LHEIWEIKGATHFGDENEVDYVLNEEHCVGDTYKEDHIESVEYYFQVLNHLIF